METKYLADFDILIGSSRLTAKKEVIWDHLSVNRCKLDHRMLTAEPPMEFHPESTKHYSTKISPEKEKSTLNNINDYHMTCVTALVGEQTIASISGKDVNVDIVDHKNNSDLRLIKTEDPDATEYSSSFADTTSDADMSNGLSEAEVESQFFGDSDFACDAFTNMFQMRKKKLTNHWRRFIQPLMWRCKWTELRIKEIESRAIKYARELEAYEQAKLPAIEPSLLDMCGTKSLPYSNACYRKKAAKRRKRKRVEKANAIGSYVSCHKLFSYIETKRSSSDGIALADDFAGKDPNADSKNRLDLGNDQALFEPRDGDASLEEVLWKIELVHSQVHKLKSQMDLLMSKYAAKFSSSENLSLLAAGDAQTSSAPSPAFSVRNGDAMYNSAHHLSDYNIGDLVLPESAISSYGEAFHIPDIIESTVGLLSAADVTFHQPHIGDSCEDILDNVLIHNEAAEVERNAFVRTISCQPSEKEHETEAGEEGESSKPHEQSVLESCLATDMHFPRNKRKRGERKAGSWCKKPSSDPDSQ